MATDLERPPNGNTTWTRTSALIAGAGVLLAAGGGVMLVGSYFHQTEQNTQQIAEVSREGSPAGFAARAQLDEIRSTRRSVEFWETRAAEVATMRAQIIELQHRVDRLDRIEQDRPAR